MRGEASGEPNRWTSSPGALLESVEKVSQANHRHPACRSSELRVSRNCRPVRQQSRTNRSTLCSVAVRGAAGRCAADRPVMRAPPGWLLSVSWRVGRSRALPARQCSSATRTSFVAPGPTSRAGAAVVHGSPGPGCALAAGGAGAGILGGDRQPGVSAPFQPGPGSARGCRRAGNPPVTGPSAAGRRRSAAPPRW